MQTKRKFPRLNQRWRINYIVLGDAPDFDEPLETYTENISAGGICFKIDQELQPDTMIGLELESDQFQQQLRALARVAWCRPAEKAYEIGVEFRWTFWETDNAQQAIADYVTAAV